MKKLRKMSCIIALLMVTIAIVSCSKIESKPKATPEETTKIYLDVLLKNDASNIDKLKLSADDSEQIRAGIEKAFLAGVSDSNNKDISISEETKNNFVKDFVACLSKVEYEVSPISSEKDNARVEIKVKAYDFKKIGADSINFAKEEYLANQSMTEQQLMELLLKKIGSDLANGTLSATPISIEFYLTLEDDIWVPLNSDVQNLMETIFPVEDLYTAL
ncbi:DUF5105 domain-containing protein [Clostridium intestinale]|uniref:DUF5105 domain-containing protein n=1 Tax=Clostridium intestinale TaxID=36845 RepID=A0A7D6VMC3_9CLOT|nr:DUF5105 domain-containing protein [Clostridium intestinale]QLY78027.1 DUF5105 domain-containing protein [Clostridium intestinale]